VLADCAATAAIALWFSDSPTSRAAGRAPWVRAAAEMLVWRVIVALASLVLISGLEIDPRHQLHRPVLRQRSRAGRPWWSVSGQQPDTDVQPAKRFRAAIYLGVLWNSLSVGLLFPLWFAASGGGDAAFLGVPLGLLAFGLSVAMHSIALRDGGEHAGLLMALYVLGLVGWMLPLCMMHLLPPLFRKLYLYLMDERPLQMLLNLWRQRSWAARANTAAKVAETAAVVARLQGRARQPLTVALGRARAGAQRLGDAVLRVAGPAAARATQLGRALRLRHARRPEL